MRSTVTRHTFYMDDIRANVLLDYARRQHEYLLESGHSKVLRMSKVKIVVASNV